MFRAAKISGGTVLTPTKIIHQSINNNFTTIATDIYTLPARLSSRMYYADSSSSSYTSFSPTYQFRYCFFVVFFWGWGGGQIDRSIDFFVNATNTKYANEM